MYVRTVNRFSYEKGFFAMLNEIRDLAGQRELIAENISGTILKDAQHLLNDFRQSRKKVNRVFVSTVQSFKLFVDLLV